MNLVFFDIDGTLLISQGAGGKSIVRVMRTIFGIREEIAEIEIHGQTDRGIASQLFQAHAIEETESNWKRFVSGYLGILGEELEACEGSLLPGVPDLLECLARSPQVELALLTGNIEKGARKKVDYFGIGDYFAWGGYGDHHRDRSDLARSAMETAASRLDLETLENVFVIGDTPNDIRCGKAIDAVTVAVATGGSTGEQLRPYTPDFLVNDLSDVESMVEILSGGVR